MGTHTVHHGNLADEEKKRKCICSSAVLRYHLGFDQVFEKFRFPSWHMGQQPGPARLSTLARPRPSGEELRRGSECLSMATDNQAS